MIRRLLVFLCAVLVANFLAPALSGAQSLPAVTVGFVHDRPGADWAIGFRDSLRLEITRILEVDFTVQMPADFERMADGTTASVQAELEYLLAEKQVDLIGATGPLGSLQASRIPDLARPVIGSWILDPEIQGVPLTQGTSGLHNYTYITVVNLLSSDMKALDLMVDYQHLVVVGSAGWLAALPGDRSALPQVKSKKTSFVVGEGTLDSVLDKLPEDTDAIYLMPMIGMSSVQISELLAAFAQLKLPVLSLAGEPEVHAGALLGVAPADWKRRMYRRVALVAAQIMADADPADIPVTMLRDGQIFYNIQTANQIGVSPPFEVIIEAVVIGEVAPQGTELVDLDHVMVTAQENNRDIAAAERAVQAGHYRVNVSKGDLLPQIDHGLNGVLIDEDSANIFPGVSEQTLAGTASFTQLLYSDKAWAGYTIEKHRQEARVGEMEQVRLDVGLEAATAYLDVLRAQAKLQVQRQNLAFSRSNYQRAEIRVSVGDANRSELYRWESKIAGEQSLLMQSTVNRRLAVFELNRVLFRPLEAPLQLEDTTLGDQYRTLISPRVDRFTLNAHGLETLRAFLVGKGLTGSPELSQYDALILATEREHSAANRSF